MQAQKQDQDTALIVSSLESLYELCGNRSVDDDALDDRCEDAPYRRIWLPHLPSVRTSQICLTTHTDIYLFRKWPPA